jgi:predicted RNA binding protein YcfA (HicA-like mRNA interferase family)
MAMKAKELVKLLEDNGWIAVRQSGSHKTFKHPDKAPVITVPMHRSDLKRGLLKKLLKLAGL